MDIGLIGLGLAGHALAVRLLAAGHAVHGYDIVAEARNRAAADGVTLSETPEDIARKCRLLLLSLPHSGVRRDLLWGEQALAPLLQAGAILLETSTSRPEDLEEDHRRLAPQGVQLIDVTLVGSSQQIAQGEALLLVGAKAPDAAWEGILEAVSSKVFYAGAPGQASRLKLVVNLVLGLNRLVLAEGLAFAERAGFNTTDVLEVLKQGATYSRVMDTKGEKMLRREYTPVARLAQHAKDVELILEMAEKLEAHTPLSRLHAQLLARAVHLGYAEADNAAIIEAFRSS